jgi:hypothetical protein
VAGKYLYVLGGSTDGSPYNGVWRSLINSDGSLNTFEACASLTTGRIKASAAVVGNYIFVLGGRKPDGSYANDYEYVPLDANGAMTSGWTTATGGMTARNYAASAVIGNAIYVFGGNNAGTSVEKATVSGSTLTFTSASVPQMTASRRGHEAVVVGNTLYLVGDEDLATGTLQATISPTGSLGAFTAGPTLTTGRGSAGAVALGNYLHVISGWSGSAGVPSNESFKLQ